MKKFLYLLIVTHLIISCGSSDTKVGSTAVQEEKTKESTSKSSMPDDDRVSGSFEVSIDGKTFKSTQLQDNYCDMTYSYKGEKSFVSVRFKDVNSKDALLFAIYGDAAFIDNPEGTIDKFMFSGQNPRKANIQFLHGDGKGAMTSTTMLEGTLDIAKFEEGIVEALFEGKGGSPSDVVTKTNLIPFSGTLSLKTEHVTKLGDVEN